ADGVDRHVRAGQRLRRNQDRYRHRQRRPPRGQAVAAAGPCISPSPMRALGNMGEPGETVGMGRATLIGFSAVVMWALLALLTNATGRLPPFQLAAMAFAVAAALGLVGRFLWPPAETPPIPAKVWLIGIAGLFGYHFFYFT